MRLHLRWGRILTLLVLLGIGTYLGGGIGVYLLYKERKNFTELEFVDVLLLRRDEIRLKQGEHDITEGLAALKEQDFRAAYNYLRSGVRRSPANLEGRLTLIAMTAPSSQEQALKLFEDGLTYGKSDFGYLRAYGQFLLGTRHDAELKELASSLLSTLEDNSEAKRLMAFFLFRAQIHLGEIASAGETFQTYKLHDSLEGVLFAADALDRAGHPFTAIELLQNFRRRFQNGSQPVVFEKLAQLYLQTDQDSQATQVALDFAMKEPLSWRPRRLLLECYDKAGREADIERAASSLVREFRDEREAISSLAQFAEKTGRVDLARKTYEVALEDGFEVARFGLLFIETYLSAERFSDVLALCEEIETENPAWLERYRPEFSGMRSIAAYGVNNTQLGDIYRNQFLSAVGRRADVLRAVASAFEDAELYAQAAAILEEATQIDDEDEQVLSNLIDLQVKLGDSRELTDRVQRLLELRRPGYAIFNAVKSELGSDRFIFANERAELLDAVAAVLREASLENLANLEVPDGTPAQSQT